MARAGRSGGGRSMGGGSRGSFGGSSGRSFGGRSGGSSMGSIGRAGRTGGLASTPRSGGRVVAGGGGFRRRPIVVSPFGWGMRRRRMPWMPWGWGGGFGRRPRVAGGGGGCMGCMPLLLIFVIGIALSSIIGHFNYTSQPQGTAITPSTIRREPLRGMVIETEYYQDLLGWIRNETVLLSGMRYFYQRTGVQPFLYITDNIGGVSRPSEEEVESYAQELYDAKFADEAHLLVIFLEYNDDYHVWYLVGRQARSVLDREAMDILMDFIDRYYYYDQLSEEEFFSRSFRDAASRIMEVTRPAWILPATIFGVLLVLLLGFAWWNRVKAQRNREAEEMERILNTPLDSFGSSEAQQRARRYEDDQTRRPQ